MKEDKSKLESELMASAIEKKIEVKEIERKAELELAPLETLELLKKNSR